MLHLFQVVLVDIELDILVDKRVQLLVAHTVAEPVVSLV